MATPEQIEHVLHPRTAAEQLHAIFTGAEHADDGRIAALAKQLLDQHDRLRAQIAAARTEIARQNVAADTAYRVPAMELVAYRAVSNALAAVETHLVAPEYRPVPAAD